MRSSSAIFSIILITSAVNAQAVKKPTSINCNISDLSLKPLSILKTESHYVIDLTENQQTYALLTPTKFVKTSITFTNWLKPQVSSTQQTQLLQDQLEITQQLGMQSMESRINLLLNQKIGKIQPANCLEQYLFYKHISTFNPSVFPAEFSAYILRSKKDLKHIRIYFSFGDGHTFESSPDWSDDIKNSLLSSPPQNMPVLQAAFTDIANTSEWSFEALFHSHPFMFMFPQAHTGGTVLPSDADIQGWIPLRDQYLMKSAWITNGLSTIKIPASQFDVLATTLPK